MLTLDQIDRLVGEVAATTLAPGVVNRIFSEAVIDSAGRDALRITIVIDDDALSKISGDATVDTLVAVQKRLFEAGEESFQSSSTPRSESSRKVAILNPEHLLEQAERLIEPPPAGPPRQVDIRRAISSAYYAVFHATLAAAARRFGGLLLHPSHTRHCSLSVATTLPKEAACAGVAYTGRLHGTTSSPCESRTLHQHRRSAPHPARRRLRRGDLELVRRPSSRRFRSTSRERAGHLRATR
jgi:hypothetical protein